MRASLLGPCLVVVLIALFVLELFTGSTALTMNDVFTALFDGGADGTKRAIVLGVRLPEAITAVLAGGGLAVCGLLMQTLFRNPLAGPSVLGISSGASLGVAVVLLLQPWWLWTGIPADAVVVAASLLGAMTALVIIVLADRRVGDGTTLLIVGLLLGYLCSAVISVLQAASPAVALKSYVLWGMGAFNTVTSDRLAWLAVPVLVGSLIALLHMKPLNALLLGDDQAATLGVRVGSSRRNLMWTTGLITGTITAFCGPIAFLGMITPHIVRALLRTGDHAKVLPITMLMGAVLAVGCDLISRSSFTGGTIPLNAITCLLGVPVVAWVLLSGKRWRAS